MSGKSEKKLRQAFKKYHNKVFQEYIVWLSCMPFRARLWYCIKLGFNLHENQIELRDKIKEQRRILYGKHK